MYVFVPTALAHNHMFLCVCVFVLLFLGNVPILFAVRNVMFSCVFDIYVLDATCTVSNEPINEITTSFLVHTLV